MSPGFFVLFFLLLLLLLFFAGVGWVGSGVGEGGFVLRLISKYV